MNIETARVLLYVGLALEAVLLIVLALATDAIYRKRKMDEPTKESNLDHVDSPLSLLIRAYLVILAWLLIIMAIPLTIWVAWAFYPFSE